MADAGKNPSSLAFRFRKELRRQWKILRAGSIARGSHQDCDAPVFIVGCGRSGTTILGQALSQHSAISYLNEPRDYWIASQPKTDVWTVAAAMRGGTLSLGADDASAKASQRIHRCFGYEQHRQGGSVLLEKLPENAFRLPFLQALFPGARFIHVWRDGVEVARSIEKKILAGGWYGSSAYKWQALRELASKTPALSDVPLDALSPFERGLLEWRLSVEAMDRCFAHMPPEQHMQVDYADFVAHPHEAIDRLYHFMGLEAEPMAHEFARSKVRRLSEPGDLAGLSKQALRIGGHWLESWQGCS